MSPGGVQRTAYCAYALNVKLEQIISDLEGLVYDGKT